MRVNKYLLLMVLAFGCFAFGAIRADEGDHSQFDEELNERDFAALRDFLKAKRALDVDDKCSNLTISGDVRTEWRHLNETCCGERLRGGGATDAFGVKPISRNDFDIEFNLYFNYVYDRTWAVAQVRYDNSAGVDDNGHPCFDNDDEVDEACNVCCKEKAKRCFGDRHGYHGSGACDDLCLKKAYFGYNFFESECSRLDIELGRRGNLYNVFDSNIQFLSRFDGLLLKYDTECECFADMYLHVAGFVVDEKVNHFAWIAEIGLLDIFDSDVDFKYSFIDWEKHGKNRCFVRNPRGFRFLNSQFTLAYNINPKLIGIPVKLYGAFLINHAARKIFEVNEDGERRHSTLANIGWYVGVLFGKVQKEGDWALEIQYQYVEAQAMPDDDCSGICRGNVLDESFTTCSRRGNTNFKGFRIEGLYAITDNITVDSIIEWSKAANKRIGGPHTYSKFELEAIYAF